MCMQQLRDEGCSGEGFSVSFSHPPQDKGLAVQLAFGSLHQSSHGFWGSSGWEETRGGRAGFGGIDTLALLGWELVCLVTLYTYEGG